MLFDDDREAIADHSGLFVILGTLGAIEGIEARK